MKEQGHKALSDAEHTAEVPVNSGDWGRRLTNPVSTKKQDWQAFCYYRK